VAVTGKGDAPYTTTWSRVRHRGLGSALAFLMPATESAQPTALAMRDFFFEAAAPPAGTPYYYQWRRRAA